MIVYTVILGKGYQLPRVTPRDGVEFICFTNIPELKPRGWELRQIAPILPADLVRSARAIKVLAHEIFPDESDSLYIDPSVQLNEDPHLLWNRLLDGGKKKVFGAMLHSFRDTLIDEFDAVMEQNLESPYFIQEHLQAIILTNADILKKKPIWTGILARRHNEKECREISRHWMTQILRYSRRDQLSLPGVLNDVSPELLGLHLIDNNVSEYHQWPIESYRRPQRYLTSVRDSMIPALIQISRLRERIEELSQSNRDLEIQRSRLQEQIDALNGKSHADDA